MRLWHSKLIPFLPKSQLLAQWRELNSIFKKQDNHILINYVYEYPIKHLRAYSKIVMAEMEKRGYKIQSYDAFCDYCNNISDDDYFDSLRHDFVPFPNHHTDRYLLQCFYNLQEKYDRGQKDFDKETYEKMEKLIKENRHEHQRF